MRWLSPHDRKVPVEVAASGPRVIQMAARLADRIVFAVGADIARLEWAIGLARQAVRGSGRDPQSLGLGAFICVAPHADVGRARRLASGTLASLSRFSVMYGTPRGPVSERDQTVLRQIHDTYDIGMHFTHGSPQSRALDDQFIDRHAVVGSPERCAERLRELASLGLDRVYVVNPSSGIDPDAQADWRRTFADQVLPRLR